MEKTKELKNHHQHRHKNNIKSTNTKPKTPFFFNNKNNKQNPKKKTKNQKTGKTKKTTTFKKIRKQKSTPNPKKPQVTGYVFVQALLVQSERRPNAANASPDGANGSVGLSKVEESLFEAAKWEGAIFFRNVFFGCFCWCF